MTELAEPVAIAFGTSDPDACMFSHAKRKPDKLENVMPPVDGSHVNNAATLGRNLDAQSQRMEVIDIGIEINGVMRERSVQYTPHHVIPGNEAWPETALLEWVDAAKGTIKMDIGYDVNAASNGIDLPGIHGLDEGAWRGAAFQMRYAFAAMACSTPKRQFHDRHNTYSSFVVNTLDAIAEKMAPKSEEELPGCGAKHCGGAGGKPYDPPLGLNGRLVGVSARLKEHLQGAESTWKMPLFTSRFALMYKLQPMTQEEARAALRQARRALD